MRSVNIFLIITLVVVVLAVGAFSAVSWFGFSSLTQEPKLQTAASSPTPPPTQPPPPPGQQAVTATITAPSGSTVFLAVGQARTFTGSASGGSGSYTFSWDFGDGTTDSGASVSKTFNQPGTFTVTLTASDGTSQGTDSIQAIISGAAFSGSITSPPTGATLTVGEANTFTASASGGTPPYNFGWDFGDGNIGTSSSFPHTYTTAGNRTVTLSISDKASPPNQVTKTIQVNVVNPPPEPVQATITTPSAGANFPVGQAVNFSGTASGGTGTYLYDWDFGDGGMALTQSASHTYSTPGTYTVDFRVRDNQNDENTETVQITISGNISPSPNPPPNQPPPPVGGGGPPPAQPPPPNSQPLTARISNPANNTTFLVNQNINFSGSASGGSGTYAFRWEFGDGSISLNASHSKSYAQAGQKTISLQVSDNAFHQDTENITITINNPPPHQPPPPNPPPNTGGGGGGGGGNNPPPVAPPIIPPVQPPVTCVPTSNTLSDLPLLVGPFAFGMRDNAQVTLLQRMLSTDRVIYPEGIVSGYYGPLTREAVKRFQVKHAILDPQTADPAIVGFAGPRTRAEINKVYRGAGTIITNCPPPTTTPTTPTAPTIIELTPEQRNLLLNQLQTIVTTLRARVVSWLSSLSTILVP